MSKLNFFQNRPKAAAMDVDGYLKRVGLSRQKPDLGFLRKLHRNHLLSVPFENLDIHYGRKIELKVANIYQKVVGERRGGISYELNTLFYNLLNLLGYSAYLASARVLRSSEFTPDFDHMVILVPVGEALYLCDVGFGDSFTEPKKIALGQVQLDYTRYYRFEKDPDDRWILKKSRDNSLFETVYTFEETAREMIEFLPRCNYHQESMDSWLMQDKIVTQLFKEGRITLTSRKLEVGFYGEQTSSEILNEDAFLAKLEQYFGISSARLLGQRLD